jgi:hypothetical protein
VNVHVATLAGDGAGEAQSVPSRPGGGQLRLSDATVFIDGDFEGDVQLDVSLDNQSWFPVMATSEPACLGQFPVCAPVFRATMSKYQRGTAKIWLFFP